MTAVTVEPPMWLRVRWWLGVFFALAVQVSLVFWLSDRAPITPRPPTNAPVVFLVEDALTRLPTLSDPLLFSPANLHGFSGLVWRKTPKLEYYLSDWTAQPSLLTLQAQQLGNAFSKFVQTNSPANFTTVDNPEPCLSSPELFLPDAPLTTRSILRVEGELAVRTNWSSSIVLPDLPVTNILSPTVVQVMVDLDGNTVSASLLSRSGSEDADKQALNLAKGARYDSIRNNAPGQSPINTLNWGRLVFEWHTVELAMTNPPPQKR